MHSRSSKILEMAWRLACTNDKDVANYGKENVNIVAKHQQTTQTQDKNFSESNTKKVTDFSNKILIPCQGNTTIHENSALGDIFENLENARKDIYAFDKSPINQNVIQDEDLSVPCQVNCIDENPASAETIEIVDEQGNVVNNIHELPIIVQNELIEQQIVVDQEKTAPKSDAEDQVHQEKRQRSRKRKIQPHEWKVTVRKKKCQSGKEYVSVRGKVVKARSIQNKKNCLQKCKFNCAKQISEDERQQAFNSYWDLSQNEKYVFLKNTTKKEIKGRKTTGDKDSRRCFSFKYFIQIKGEDIRVCKKYFLGTYNISQKPVYTAHLEPDIKKDNRGKQSKNSKIKEDIINHIKSFPVIDSHYCRQSTKRKYLESTLSVAKMYDLYQVWCKDKEITAAKLSYYRYVFTTEFNYGFHIPKKDRCIKCESFKIKNKESSLTLEETDAYEIHVQVKNQMRTERNKDRENKVPTLCFDLENVITCPRSEVGDFFYSQKLNIYNLTGHFSTTGQVYCAIWTEAKQGRSGNILASAFRKILDQVLQDNNITDLITWSDSCVSQNRNSFISFAIIDAMRNHPELNSITMKYSVPGHGAIQEVDSAHSSIDRYLDKTEFYSPLSFIKNLKSVNTKKPFCILQMKDEDFKDYESCSKKLLFNKIPFSKVASLRFTQSLSEIEYKLNHVDEFIKETLKPDRTTARRNKVSENPKNENEMFQSIMMTLKPKNLPIKNSLSEDKIKAIKKMMTGCMPDMDKKYFASFLNSLK